MWFEWYQLWMVYLRNGFWKDIISFANNDSGILKEVERLLTTKDGNDIVR